MSFELDKLEAQRLLQIAQQYEQLNDVYHAVKLYKKAIRTAPAWSKPYYYLSLIYRARKEWKPIFHYSQKTVECNSENLKAWWNLGLAATVLQRWEVAREAWEKLGHKTSAAAKLMPIQIAHRGFKEIVWTRQIDVVRVRIESIPHPFSRRRYGEIIMHDRTSIGKLVVQQKRVDIYKEVQALERSFFDTYSVLLHTDKASDIDLLDKLCLEAELGFDNWTNSNEVHINSARKAKAEYYSKNFFKQIEDEQTYHVIGIAAKRRREVLEVLETWRIITLANYSQLERH